MRHVLAFAAALGLGLLAFAAAAHDYKAGDIHVVHPWARATPPGAPTGAAYMTIANSGAVADRLVAVSSPAAQRAEVHQMTMEGDIMRMRHLADGLEIAAGGEVALEPGGYHLMLIGLDAPLVEDTRVPLTLEFARAGTIEVELAVERPGGDGGDHGGH